MPVSHITKVFSIADAKIGKLLTDPAGGSPTYAAIVDVPGIREIGITVGYTTAELLGDNAILDTNTSLESVEISAEHAKLSLDVLPVLLGGTTTDTGTTPNQIATYGFLGASTPSYWKLEGVTPAGGADIPAGDLHVLLHKLIVTSYEFGFGNRDYQVLSFEARANPLVSTDKLMDVKINETAAAIT